MKKTYRHILARALAAVPLACSVLLSSCYTDEYDGCPTDGQQPVAVRLNISAGEPGDLNATRAEGDEIEGEQHEFMHTLYIYIVDSSGRLVKKFENPLEGSALASTGDVKSWQTRKFTLEPGTYTVFAFANIDEYQGWVNDEDTQLSGYEFIHDEFKEEGGLSDTFYDFRLVDPAYKINFNNGMFIPMSAKEEITITENYDLNSVNTIDIGLDRLVTKVKMTINDAAENIPENSTITFGNYSENVPLMGKDDNENVDNFTTYFGERTKSTTIENVKSGDVLTFYVNETLDGAEKPFTVTLSTKNSSGVSTYTATTERTELPRNSIYPLTLTFSDFGISITPRAWLEVLAIGYKVEYTPEEDGVYRVELATGSYFELTPEAITAGNDTIRGVTWEWTQDGNLPTGYVVKIDDNTDTVTGNLPAGGKSYYGKFTLKLNGKWTYNGADYDRTYTFIIDVCHDEVWAMDRLIDNGANSRAAEMPVPAYRLAPEYLNMFKVK